MKWRIILNTLIVFIVFITLGAKVAYLQVLKHDMLSSRFEKQFIRQIEIEPIRGKIYDQRGNIFAMNILVDSYYCAPAKIRNRKEVLSFIEKLGLDKNEFKTRIKSKKNFFWIKRKVLPQKSLDIKDIKVPAGIGIIKEGRRCYPKGKTASHVIGVAGIDNCGRSGIEYKMEKYLRGDTIKCSNGKDALGRNVMLEKILYANNKTSCDVYLTIDETVQHSAERHAQELFEKSKAKAVSIIVQKVSTGEILALANRPNFDANNIKKEDIHALSNKAITAIFEPGSTLKIFVAAAAIEEKIVSLDTEIFCENGKYNVSDFFQIKDHEEHGNMTVKDIITHSSNIGMAKIGMQLESEVMYNYLTSFGFGNYSGIGFSGETRGLLRHPKKWSSVSPLVIAFGQEIGVNMLQLITAFSCIANKGFLVEPRIVKYIKDSRGKVLLENNTHVVRQVVSEDTCEKIIEAMENVIKEGTGDMAFVKGYRIAGKTGTAQKIDQDTRKYSEDKYIASFAGFFPVSNPEVSILVIADEPEGVYWGGEVCAPVFAKLVQDIAWSLHITPDDL